MSKELVCSIELIFPRSVEKSYCEKSSNFDTAKYYTPYLRNLKNVNRLLAWFITAHHVVIGLTVELKIYTNNATKNARTYKCSELFKMESFLAAPHSTGIFQSVSSRQDFARSVRTGFPFTRELQ